MKTTPKSLRLQIGIFGRTNVGKSSFLNYIAKQDVAITSPVPGTTTDVVEKTMELLPVGPVVFLDTAGLDDVSELSNLRIQKTKKIFNRSDVILLIIEPDVWTEYEENVLTIAKEKNIPYIIVVNKIDKNYPSRIFIDKLKQNTERFLLCSSIDLKDRDKNVNLLKKYLLEITPDSVLNAASILEGILPKGGLALLIVPIDLEAPKGRIILPQVQVVRDCLDNDAASLIVKEHQYKDILKKLKVNPDIVICDSQVVDKMVNDSPKGINCTTFSILFTHWKADLACATKSVFILDYLRGNDKILIAESCSHHAIEDDIGRVKIPRWLNEYLGFKPEIDICSGRDFPEDLRKYKLVIHCGSCMITRKETLRRIEFAKEAGVAITNYGVCIAYLKGALARVLEPFPYALEIFKKYGK
ncbi:MAG: [FeFe] hydrogenase H-cluster maturation GTPase HydF [Candidatus Omnitrophota bacterium]